MPASRTRRSCSSRLMEGIVGNAGRVFKRTTDQALVPRSRAKAEGVLEPWKGIGDVAPGGAQRNPGKERPNKTKALEGRRSESCRAPAPFQGFDSNWQWIPRVPLRSTRGYSSDARF